MATDSVNIGEDAEMAECDGDKVVTMMDVLQEQQDFEEDANAVLGASDDKNCTYPKGYIKRQALYACLTCCAEAKVDPMKRAGVCLACSLTCHENHELIELYTKRNFRCDCGNPKFNSHPCQFTSDKTDLNEENIYNQNFSGLYCTCHRPYPDPESTFEDDMIQCIICEDWLHAEHLETVVPANDQYSEMICKSCMEKNEFLHDYSLFAVNVEAADVDIITVNGDTKSADNSLCNGELEKEKLGNGETDRNIEIEGASVTVNGDVEMNDDKEKSDEKVIDGSENEKIDESTAPVASEEIKQENSKNSETSESKSKENEKADNVDDNKIDLEEKPVETTDTNEVTKDDTSTITENSSVEKSIADINKDTESISGEKSDAAEVTAKVDFDQNDDTSRNDDTVSTGNINDDPDIKLESTDTVSEKIDEILKEPAETQEHNIEQSTKKETDSGNKVYENNTDSNEKTEQQLLDDLSTLTADQISEEKEATTEETPAESIEQSDDSNTNEDIQANELPNKTYEGGDTFENNPDSEAKTDTDIAVPDTSQSKQKTEETENEKSDSVMDAIDELLQTANEASKTSEENKESITSTESIETKESKDVEMTSRENKVDNKVTDKKEDNGDSIVKTNIEDVEMRDIITEKEPSVSESKTDDDHASGSEYKDKETEGSDSASKTEAAVNKNDVEIESSKNVDAKSKDTPCENISKENEVLNETEKDSQETTKTDENGSTNKNKPSIDDTQISNEPENAKEHKRKLSTDITEDTDTSSKKAKLECIRPKGVKKIHKGATFWPSNFRQKLCTCGECISMYKDLKVLFLTDIEDTVFAYESLGKENVAGGASQYEKGLQALSSLDRIQQINALTEYNKMRDKLLDFLKSFKDRKEVVKEEDIKGFFAGMKPRREPDGVYFCR